VASTHVRQVRLGDHLCLPFTNDDEQGEVVGAYIADGLIHGERVLYYADRTEPAAIDRWLDRRGVDGALAVARGQLTVRTSHGEEFDPASVVTGIQSEMRQARADGYQGLRLTGEMSWALHHNPDSTRLHEYESGISTTVSSAGDVAAICQYDERLFDSDAVSGLVAFHSSVVRIDPLHDDRRLRVLPTFNPRGLKVVGVVDSSTVAGLVQSLNEAVTWPETVLQLDLSEMDFIDVAGVRAIVRLAELLAPERRLQVEHMTPTLRKVMSVVGWDQTPGLSIADGRAGEVGSA
jgi:anti-anti-sigma regulatory factor